jgi:TPR repeat protein
VALLALQNVTAASPGATAYQAQHYQQAFQLLSSEAKEGDSEAQYLLGSLYLDGLGIASSATDAVLWLERAVSKRHAGAAQLLGKIYLSGMGVTMDVDKGVHYMQLADQFNPGDNDECD